MLFNVQVDCATAASVSSLPGGSADSPDPVTPVLVMLPTIASSSPTWAEASQNCSVETIANYRDECSVKYLD